MNWSEEQVSHVPHPSECGPGLVCLAEVGFEKVTEMVTGFGEKGLPVERLVSGMVDQIRRYITHRAPVGEYLADQLLLPMALAGGGKFVTAKLTRHAMTNMEVIEKFLPVKFQVTKRDDGLREVAMQS